MMRVENTEGSNIWKGLEMWRQQIVRSASKQTEKDMMIEGLRSGFCPLMQL